MTSRTALRIVFTLILLAMLAVTGWASWVQPVWEWSGLTRTPDHAWTIATLFDAYFGFITFYVWVLYKETRWLPRIGWCIGILLLGNMAMACYMLKELHQLRDGDDMNVLLTRRHGVRT